MSHGRRKPLPQWRSAVASNNLAPETYRSGQAPTTGAPPASATARQRLAAGTARPRQRLRAASGHRSGCLNCILQFKFARKLARPPDFVRGTWMRLGELSSLLIFLVRAGWGYGRRLFSASKELGCGGLCPHPLRKLSFLRTFLLLPPLRTRGASCPMAGASHYHNGAAPSLRTTLLQKRIAAGKRRPPARSPRRLLRVSSWLRALPARVSDCVQAQPALSKIRRCGRAG